MTSLNFKLYKYLVDLRLFPFPSLCILPNVDHSDADNHRDLLRSDHVSDRGHRAHELQVPDHLRKCEEEAVRHPRPQEDRLRHRL